ncbi:methyltransferase [Mesorhizobium sp. L-8-10]|uniref:FkbM family methyltransferase n=1 Tax=Mesorhizobium sp. L-8-10 TaxID=2744523 RepID=UPI0019261738|nr:FkbM family methyltransferase [Mesorhizobium sp. L-8-10]BCH29253.1 methyltransferase [Mesorhizobium sp. L-8-10]
MKAAAELDTTMPFGGRRASLGARLLWWLATHRLLARETRGRLRRIIRGRHRGPYDVIVDGVNFRTYPTENYCDRMLFGAGALPEPAERVLLRPFVRPGMHFVDVGANVGTYALWIAVLAGPSARILALEPHPRTFAKLRFNIEANGATNVTAVNLGAGPNSGVMQLFFDGGGNVGQSSMLVEGAGAASNRETVRRTVPETVKVAPLAEILEAERFPAIDLLKIDVEGYEDRALLPLFSEESRSLWPAALLIETVQSELWQTDCLAFLAARGYRKADATAQNTLLVRDR